MIINRSSLVSKLLFVFICLVHHIAVAQSVVSSSIFSNASGYIETSQYRLDYVLGLPISKNALSLPITVGVERNPQNAPTTFALHQNYPNPFNPSTKIQFGLPSRAAVTLKVFNVLGQEIETLANAEYEAGIYSVDWQKTDLPAGVYFYRLRAGRFMETKKMLLLK